MKKRIALFGSTGSIGKSTLNVVRAHPDLFEVTALIANKSIDALAAQIEEFHPRHAYITSRENAAVLRERFPALEVFCGEDGMTEIASQEDYDIGVSALVGVAGLSPTCHMIRHGKTVALANKEVLVTGGQMVMELAARCGARLVTVDSEHSAIMQCLNGENHSRIDKLLLTASGGPFFDKPITDDITPETALCHPTWKMGPKVTVDSATMMNKGFEIIEARWLFDIPPEKIEVVIHRQSLVHSMVQFTDGTIMANIAPANMEIPIAYALSCPDRLPNAHEKLDLFAIGQLRFERPDTAKFPCLRLAREAAAAGHSHQVVLNAANEVMVDAFLHRETSFTDIPRFVSDALACHEPTALSSVEDVLALDGEVRRKIREQLKGRA